MAAGILCVENPSFFAFAAGVYRKLMALFSGIRFLMELHYTEIYFPPGNAGKMGKLFFFRTSHRIPIR